MPKTLLNIKEDILIATRRLLSEEGYEKLNVRTIALQCGIATGTFYNYYNSKQEVVEEILKTEWNMMLRRIEQGSKADMNTIDKLGIVYYELDNMMNDVHNIWFEKSSFRSNDEDLSRIKDHKQIMLKSLSNIILHIVSTAGGDKDYELLSDVICRLFASYTYEGNVDYSKLIPVIEALLK